MKSIFFLIISWVLCGAVSNLQAAVTSTTSKGSNSDEANAVAPVDIQNFSIPLCPYAPGKLSEIAPFDPVALLSDNQIQFTIPNVLKARSVQLEGIFYPVGGNATQIFSTTVNSGSSPAIRANFVVTAAWPLLVATGWFVVNEISTADASKSAYFCAAFESRDPQNTGISIGNAGNGGGNSGGSIQFQDLPAGADGRAGTSGCSLTAETPNFILAPAILGFFLLLSFGLRLRFARANLHKRK